MAIRPGAESKIILYLFIFISAIKDRNVQEKLKRKLDFNFWGFRAEFQQNSKMFIFVFRNFYKILNFKRIFFRIFINFQRIFRKFLENSRNF